MAMAEQEDWRYLLTASARYDNIQKIQNARQENGNVASVRLVFGLENEAYQASSSREEYDAACNLSPPSSERRCSGSWPPCVKGQGQGQGEAPQERIGPYENCQYVASGATAEVYRCGDRALKVITERHNIEPHNPFREAKILGELDKPCLPILDTFRDQEQRFTLVFPYMPLTLAALLERAPLSDAQARATFGDIFQALAQIHQKGIIHRDIKPQAILLKGPNGPAYVSDFGTAWHPVLSTYSEPADAKILDIGTGPYRAPEVLFGDRSYGTAVDMWAAGCMLAESVRRPPKPLFESRPANQDGNQLGLILSIFKTIGTPTRESWPEAGGFNTPPFDVYQVFQRRPWEDILDGVAAGWRDLVKALVRYDSGRMTAEQALEHPYLNYDCP